MNKKFAFFGTPELAVHTLEALKAHDMIPSIIITAEDAPQGRGLVLTPSPVKVWGLAHSIPVYAPAKLRNNEEIHALCRQYEFAVLAAYGKIISQSILDCFPKGILNVHPSMLPLYRGPSPLESQIISDETLFGVTIIKLDSACDHGPIIAQRELSFQSTPSREELGARGFIEGGNMLAQYLGPYLAGILPPLEQIHTDATFTQKIEKKDGEILITDFERIKYLKFLAYKPWPGTFFFVEHGSRTIRVKITDAQFENNTFIIKKVIPEGKKEMSYGDFLRGVENKK